jgi:phosphatidylserine decarboxylase
MIVRDGIYYAVAAALAGTAVQWLTSAWFALPLYVFAVFCLYFFRDPERVPPKGPVAVSPADGKVVAVKPELAGKRISIFLNVFNVHVNRSPVAGIISDVQYKKGCFKVASKEVCSEENEQNVVTVQDEGSTVVFKQIAGLVARRIVFTKRVGDCVKLGERIGLIKFGSRMDVLLGPEWEILVQPGMKVVAGQSVLARRR